MALLISTQSEYDDIVAILLKKDSFICNNKDKRYRLNKKAQNFIVIEEVLYLKDMTNNTFKIVIPTSNKEKMEEYATTEHAKTHYGMRRMESHCKSIYHSISREIIRRVTNSCTVCSLLQPLKTKEKFNHILASTPFERIMIDLIDLRLFSADNDQYAWILTCVDVFSKFAFTYPLKAKNAESVVSNMKNLFYKHGTPKIIQCDNGKEFTNSTFSSLCKSFKIKLIHSRPRHPQSNGQVERFNQTLTRYLSKFIAEKEGSTKRWVEIIDAVTYDYNVAQHNATGKSPFLLFYGRSGFNTVLLKDYGVEPSESNTTVQNEDNLDIKDIESEHITAPRLPTGNITINESEANNTNVHYDNKKYLERMDRKQVHTSIYNFQVGEEVLVSKDFDTNTKTKKKKFDSFYHEKTKIIEIMSENRVKLVLDGQVSVVAMNRIKKV